MKQLTLLLSMLCLAIAYGQNRGPIDLYAGKNDDGTLLAAAGAATDNSSAPNSYIYDINLANYGGIKIPVKKAYDVWKNNEYFKTAIPSGTLSASVYWEDVKGLISSATVEGSGEDAKIKVMVDKAKGKGNAVIAFKINNTVYWSWHIWVTDDPTKNAITYINNASGGQFTNTFMDRNLGAVSNDFLGNDWHKTGGLLYQWGRKDPFPTLIYKDATRPIIYSEFGNIRGTLSAYFVTRPSDVIGENIQYSVKNPLKMINQGPDVSSNSNPSVDRRSWFGDNDQRADLWADNNGGSITTTPSYSQKSKSPFDPCPDGWRVPSFSRTVNPDATSTSTDPDYDPNYDNYPKYSPWGKSGVTEAIEGTQDKPQAIHQYFPNLTVYPGLGFDFKSGSDNYHLGQISTTGHYTLKNNGDFQDEGSESYLWGATQTAKDNKDTRGGGLRIINDAMQSSIQGQYRIETFNGTRPVDGNAVRCVKDDSTGTPPDYVSDPSYNYTVGLDNPNSYLVVKSDKEQKIEIPVNKAFAVYNQYLTNHQWPPDGTLSANIYWTTDYLTTAGTHTDLLTAPELVNLDPNHKENAEIKVTVNPGKSGNAVVSLHIGPNGNSTDPVLWSWHIWVSNSCPIANPITYTTEKRHITKLIDYSSFLAYNTTSGMPPLTTTFMDRNLGALEFDVTDNTKSKLTGGIQYQWGRKDPIPTFLYVGVFDGKGPAYDSNYPIHIGSTASGSQSFTQLTGEKYAKPDDILYGGYGAYTAAPASDLKTAVEKPLTYFYMKGNNGYRHWLDGGSTPNDLWGHGTKKSVFDPCPEGWRVPDFANAEKDAGSPWYKDGLPSNVVSISQGEETIFGGGKRIYYFTYGKDDPNNTRGWNFADSNYKIGQIPSTGIRGQYENQVVGSGAVTSYHVLAPLWSASPTPNGDNTFNAFEVSYDPGVWNDLSPLIAYNAKWGVSVRCAKDEKRFLKSFEDTTTSNGEVCPDYSTLGDDDIPTSGNNTQDIVLHPNPTSGIFKILLPEISRGTVQVYSTNGSLVLTQSFSKQKEVEINLQKAYAGIYFVKIQTEKQTVTKKVIIKK